MIPKIDISRGPHSHGFTKRASLEPKIRTLKIKKRHLQPSILSDSTTTADALELTSLTHYGQPWIKSESSRKSHFFEKTDRTIDLGNHTILAVPSQHAD